MVSDVKWTKYLGMSLLSFAAIMLELFSIFVIEKIFLHVDVWNYTSGQRNVHCIITACLWAAFIASVLFYTRRHYQFPVKAGDKEKISARDWVFALICLAGCKVMTFIDWHTLKVIGEFRGKDLLQFCAQYLYYMLEVGIVLLIMIYGQKAIETRLHKQSAVPYGGIILAFTWGIFHFVSRGVGIEIWNGVSCMIFAVLSGLMYVKVKRRILCAYVLVAIGYLL